MIRRTSSTFQTGCSDLNRSGSFCCCPLLVATGIFLSLQSVQMPALSFVLMNPFSLMSDYAPQLSEEELRFMEAERSQELCFYVMCVVREPVGETYP